MIKPKIVVVIPTYNEVENIGIIINKLNLLELNLGFIIVDDSSPDGTGLIVKNLQSSNSKLHLIERPSKQGLGTAYIKGFEWALSNSFDYIVQIDADMSHDCNAIPNMIKLFDNKHYFVTFNLSKYKNFIVENLAL